MMVVMIMTMAVDEDEDDDDDGDDDDADDDDDGDGDDDDDDGDDDALEANNELWASTASRTDGRHRTSMRPNANQCKNGRAAGAVRILVRAFSCRVDASTKKTKLPGDPPRGSRFACVVLKCIGIALNGAACGPKEARRCMASCFGRASGRAWALWPWPGLGPSPNPRTGRETKEQIREQLENN